AATDIADLPLATLRGSRVEEVVVLGRRGPAQAAFTVPELVGLAGLTDIDVVIDDAGVGFDLTTAKGRLLAELAARPRPPVRGRLDQAWTDRVHRHQQELLGGDRRCAPRRPGGRTAHRAGRRRRRARELVGRTGSRSPRARGLAVAGRRGAPARRGAGPATG